MSDRAMHGTTILAVRRDGRVALGGDGQVTVGDTVVKAQARKVRALKDGAVLAGFAGSAATASLEASFLLNRDSNCSPKSVSG